MSDPVRSIVVTGASAGVGRAVAVRLARPGVIVGLVARDALALEAVAREVEAKGAQATILACDVADAGALRAAARRAAEAQGGLDLWVNAARVTVYGTLGEVTPEEFRRVTEVCYLGFVHGTMAALGEMRGTGVIVQIGSGLAYRGVPLQSAYCGAKHAIRGFSGAVRAELMAEGRDVTITEVHLPAVNTPQFDWARTHRAFAPRPAGPVYQPEAIAEAVAAAIARPAREYWLGRQGPLMILGNTLLPGLLDRMMARSGIGGQTSDEPVAPDRRDNLFAPVAGLHRMRGRFSDEAMARVPAFDARTVRAVAVGMGLGLAFGIGLLAGLGLG